jgi:hypothetical protein
LTPPYQPRAMKVRRLSAMSQYIQAEVRSWPTWSIPSVTVWGCFSGKKGRGSLLYLSPGPTWTVKCTWEF